MKLNETSDIGINKWANGKSIAYAGESGEGENKIIGWVREDGVRAIETNGAPVWECEDGFEAAWESLSLAML